MSHYWQGKKHTTETKQRMSRAHKGMKKPWAGKSITEKGRKKLEERMKGNDLWKYKKHFTGLKGEKSPHWKGGRSTRKRYFHLHTTEYKKWRMAVFMRDSFACQYCGIRGNQIGGYLEAHHIKGWTKYPELRYKVENGVTLCRKCHKLIPKR